MKHQTIKEVIDFLKFLKPKSYNTITRILIYGSLSLLSTPLMEIILISLLHLQLNIPLPLDYAPLVGLSIIILALIYHGINYHTDRKISSSTALKNEERQTKVDTSLFKRIKEVLPSDGSIRFVRENNFTGFGFRWSSLSDVDNFLLECEKPEFKFLDSELESIKNNLCQILNDFRIKLSANSFYLDGKTDITSIPKEWEIEQPKRFWEVVKYLNDKQSEAWKEYELLIQKARIKLDE